MSYKWFGKGKKLGTENGTLISKYWKKFWDIDIEEITVSQLNNKACMVSNGNTIY